LFRTSLYARVEAELAEQAKQAMAAALEAETHRRTLLGEAGAATPDEAAVAVAALANEASAAREVSLTAEAKLREAQIQLDDGRRAAQRLEAASRTADELQKLQAKSGVIESLRIELEAAQRAQS